LAQLDEKWHKGNFAKHFGNGWRRDQRT
jgi:hypothetical protein